MRDTNWGIPRTIEQTEGEEKRGGGTGPSPHAPRRRVLRLRRRGTPPLTLRLLFWWLVVCGWCWVGWVVGFSGLGGGGWLTFVFYVSIIGVLAGAARAGLCSVVSLEGAGAVSAISRLWSRVLLSLSLIWRPWRRQVGTVPGGEGLGEAHAQVRTSDGVRDVYVRSEGVSLILHTLGEGDEVIGVSQSAVGRTFLVPDPRVALMLVRLAMADFIGWEYGGSAQVQLRV